MIMFDEAPPDGIDERAAGLDCPEPVELVGVAVAVTRVVEVERPVDDEEDDEDDVRRAEVLLVVDEVEASEVVAASTPLTVVWTSPKQLVAPGRGVVTVLVKLRAFPSPFSKNAKTSNSCPASSPSTKLY